MLNLGIPNDSIVSRQQNFHRLMTYYPGTTFKDEVLPYMRYYLPNVKTVEDRLWLGALYSVCYSVTSAIQLFLTFPTVKSASNIQVLEDWWKVEKSNLYFNPDRRYLKSNNQVVTSIYSITQAAKNGMVEYVLPKLKISQKELYKSILKEWKYFGPHATFLFFDTILEFLPDYYIDVENIDWKNCGQTVVEGMAFLLGEEELIETKKYDLDKYNTIVDGLCEYYGEYKTVIETTLCAYRKYFKATRYYGYYADRFLIETLQVSDLMKDKFNVDIWEMRKNYCPEELLGEVGGWNKIRSNKLKDFLNTGNFYYGLTAQNL